jgi:tetratricopeptide (TPR) repeat protein
VRRPEKARGRAEALAQRNLFRELLALRDDQARPGMQVVSPTLQAVIELSLAALPDDRAREAFTQLAVFAAKPADFSREAALAVWNMEAPEGDRWLRVLTQRNLLEITSGGRFSLHQLLAEVARVRLGEQLVDTAERHCDYYLGLVDQDREAWRTIEAELPQVRQAWQWASSTSGQDARVLDLVGAMRLFLERRGLGTTQLAWYERALGAARLLGQRSDEGTLLNNIGVVHQSRGELDQALSYYEQALPIRREVGDRSGEAITQFNIGMVHRSRGEMSAAVAALECAVELDELIGHPDLASDRRVLEQVRRERDAQAT